MPRVRPFVQCISILLFSLLGVHLVVAQTTTSSQSSALLNIKEALNEWTKEAKEGGRLNEFPKTVVDGDIYEHAHKMAEYQIAYPASAALDLTHDTIATRCENTYSLHPSHVTNVFANTVPGERLMSLLEVRNSLDSIDKVDFDTSCVEVVRCYLRDQLEARDINPATRNAYTNTTFTTCMTIVQDIYSTMVQRTAGLSMMRNSNYGDDVFMNADPNDSPYDLLSDIEAIGDMLFVQNDPAAEIHFYDLPDSVRDYKDNDPDDLTYYEEIDPSEKERLDRLMPTSGDPRGLPDKTTGEYAPEEPMPGGADNNQLPTTTPRTVGGPLRNIICEEPAPYDDQMDSELDDAEIQQKETTTYNNKLTLDDLTAIALGAQMAPELHELFGLDDAGEIPERDTAQTDAAGLVEEITDLEGDSLQQLKEHVQGCIEEFTESDPNQRRKILWKSITQPTTFTKCVFEGICKEIGDESGRGLYRIKICKEPRKGGTVVANKKVMSVEDIMDELLNVCHGLQDSGQLIEHNKTKDHMEHKLMRVQLGNKLSFGLSVIFKPMGDTTDPASLKRMMRENNTYLEKIILGISDELSFVDERNKYLVIHNPEHAKTLLETSSAQQAFDRAETYLLSKDRSDVAAIRETRSQQTHYAKTLDELEEYVVLNTELWRYANESMHAMRDIRSLTQQAFQASPGK